MSQTNIDCGGFWRCAQRTQSAIAAKSRRWLVKTPPSTSALAAAHLTAKGIRKSHLETGLWRVNFIAASEASENCCAVEPNGGA
jgi:hypothetical protein